MELFQLNPGLMLWTWIVFLLTFIIVGKIGLKPFLNSLEDREKKINESLIKAKEVDDKLAAINEEHKKIIESAKQQASSIIDNAKKDAKKEAEKIIESARHESNRIIESSREQIIAEREAMISGIKMEIANLIIKGASAVIKQDMNKEEHKKFVENEINIL